MLLLQATALLTVTMSLVVTGWAELTESEEDYILNAILSDLDNPRHAKRTNELDNRSKKTIYVGKEFNNCPTDEPFPCKTSNKCISLKHVCDGNYDCPERWDEDQEVCIAYQRVPAEDLLDFVKQQANWLVPAFFDSIVKGPKDLERIASSLSTSPNIDVFQTKLHLDRDAAKNFEKALYAVRGNDMGTLERFGMRPDSWSKVKTVFKNLIDSGLL